MINLILKIIGFILVFALIMILVGVVASLTRSIPTWLWVGLVLAVIGVVVWRIWKKRKNPSTATQSTVTEGKSKWYSNIFPFGKKSGSTSSDFNGKPTYYIPT